MIDVKVENKFTKGGEAMDNSSSRLKLAPFALAGLMALPISAQAEDDGMIEEVVVTGSYIARAVEEQSNPVDVYDRSEWLLPF